MQALLLGILTVACLILLRPVAGSLLLGLAKQELLRGDFHRAESWTELSSKIAGTGFQQTLMRAAIARSQSQWPEWEKLLQQAEQSGAPQSLLVREQKLYQLAAGRLQDLQSLETMLATVDVSLPEILDAVLPGVLVSERFDLAEQLLMQWSQQDAQDPNMLYWSAMLAEQQSLIGYSDLPDQVSLLERVLQHSPYHQRARLAMAQIEEDQDRFQTAYQAYAQLWLRDELSEAQVGAARMLRRMGRYDQARRTLGDLSTQAAKIERAIWHAEQGEFGEALGLLEEPESLSDKEAKALTLHLAGRDAAAQELFAEVARRREQQHQAEERSNRVGTTPQP